MAKLRHLTVEELELTKDIAHTIIHRMTLWQWIMKGGYWRKQYDKACEELASRDSKSG